MIQVTGKRPPQPPVSSVEIALDRENALILRNALGSLALRRGAWSTDAIEFFDTLGDRLNAALDIR